MANRSRKKGPQSHGYGRGDWGSTSGGRAVTSRSPPYTEGAYRNKPLIHALTSLIGCMVEVKKVTGEVYEGILRTASPQMDIALELAHIKSNITKPLSKCLVIQTLSIKWSEVVAISAVTQSEHKDIFKTDTEISSHTNGVMGNKELQRFEFDEEISENTSQEGLEEGGEHGWTPEAMFDTNRMKFNVGSSFDPQMSEYTTSLTLEDTDKDMKRKEDAERKAKQIEIEGKTCHGIDDAGTEEEMFSSVQRTQNQSDTPTTSVPVDVTVINGITTSKNNEYSDKNIITTSNDDEMKVDVDYEKNEEEEVEEQSTSLNGKEEVDLLSTSNHGDKSPETKPKEIETQTTIEEDPKAEDVIRSFKLNPTAKEFKPSESPSNSTTSTSSNSPVSSHPVPYSSSRIPRQKGPRGPRPPLFNTEHPPMYSYLHSHVPSGVTGVRPIQMIHPQSAQLAQMSTVTSPVGSTGLMNVLRSPFASQVIGPQGSQTQFYGVPTSLATAVSHPSLGQQVLIPSSQQAAIFSHPHHAFASAMPQTPMVYLPSPLHPSQGGPYLSQQLTAVPSGLMSFPQSQGGGKQ